MQIRRDVKRKREPARPQDVLVGTGELVEQGGLTAVLVARQRKGQGLSLIHI